MTKEEYKEKMQALEAAIRANVAAYNTAYVEKDYDKASDINAQLEKDVGEYTSLARTLCYQELIESEDPMMAAVQKMSFNTIGYKDVQTGEGEVKVLQRQFIDEKPTRIDLFKLDKFSRDRKNVGIGKDDAWYNKLERLNLLFALDCAVQIGKGADFLKEMADNYAISSVAKEIDLGAANPKAGTPISNKGLLESVKAVVTAMLGEEWGNRALTHDVKFLKYCSARKSRKALTIECADPRRFRGYMLEACNRIVTNGHYDASYKAIKK